MGRRIRCTLEDSCRNNEAEIGMWLRIRRRCIRLVLAMISKCYSHTCANELTYKHRKRHAHAHAPTTLITKTDLFSLNVLYTYVKTQFLILNQFFLIFGREGNRNSLMNSAQLWNKPVPQQFFL